MLEIEKPRQPSVTIYVTHRYLPFGLCLSFPFPIDSQCFDEDSPFVFGAHGLIPSPQILDKKCIPRLKLVMNLEPALCFLLD
jgi:hypothetical protein